MRLASGLTSGLSITASIAATGLAVAITRALVRWPREWAPNPTVSEVLQPMAWTFLGGVTLVLLVVATAAVGRRSPAPALAMTAALVAPLGLSLVVGIGLLHPVRGLTKATAAVVVIGLVASITRVLLRRREPLAITSARSAAVVVALVLIAETVLAIAVVRHRPTHAVTTDGERTWLLDDLRRTFRGEGPAWGSTRVLPLGGRLALGDLPRGDAFLTLRLGLPPEATGVVTIHAGDGGETCAIENHDPHGGTCSLRLGSPPDGAQLWFVGNTPFVYLINLDLGPRPALESRWLRGAGDAPRRFKFEDTAAATWRKVSTDGETRNAVVLVAPGQRCFGLDSRADPRTLDATLLEGLAEGQITIRSELRDGDHLVASGMATLDRRDWIPLGLDSVGSHADRVCVEVTGEAVHGWSIAVAEPLARRPQRAVPAPLNIVLVSIDTLRADVVGAYGGAAATPAFDRLAAHGVLFLRAVAPASWTLPSHASIFTGLLPSHHQLWGPRQGVLARRLGDSIPTLAKRLREHGYTTQATTGGAFVSAIPGLARGFDRFNEKVVWEAGKDLAGVRARTAKQLEQASEPFFQFVHTYSVHSPYGGAPAPDPDSYREDPAAAKTHYLNGVSYTDSLLDDLLAMLDLRGVRERTLVVVTSDHGEEFADHDPQSFVDGHGHSVFEELLHVPLLIVGPGATPGLRVTQPVSLCDLAPTLLELAGAEPLGTAIDGHSLVGTLRDDHHLDHRVVVAELASEPPQLRAARWGDVKLISTATAESFYDLAVDPGEHRPASDHPAAARLRAALLGLHDAPPAITSGGPTELDPQVTEQLRALGYVQ